MHGAEYYSGKDSDTDEDGRYEWIAKFSILFWNKFNYKAMKV